MPNHSDEQRRIMAADRQRLAQALAAEAARRKMFESIPEAAGQGLPQTPERPMGWNDYLENLSIGLGRGAVNNLEGIKGMVTSPVESLKGVATGVAEAVRNPRMVAEALKQTGQRAMSGPLGLGEVIGENVNMMRVPGKPVMHELDVYHGTPHRFPATEANPLGEFDASKIGTGEGAQAYGHGIYLAQAPGTAEIYKRGLAEDVIAVDGNRIAAKRSVEARRDPESIAVNALISAKSGQVDDPFATAMQRLGGKYGPRNEYDAKAIEVIRDWRNRGAKIEEGGVMYKADLPDEMIGRMLDWDKPIKDQPEAVRKAIDRIESEFGMRNQPYKNQEATGFWYGALTDTVGGQQNASKLLKEYGVPGIAYLDAGSRGQGGTGTRNFVVFPGEEKKVRILERK